MGAPVDRAPSIPVSLTERPVAAVFAETAARHRDRVAIRWNGFSLSYAALAAEVEALAATLAAAGGARPAPLALLLDDPVRQVVAMLASLRAGMPFVPLSPDDPPARIAGYLDRARPAALVIDDATRPLADEVGSGVPRVPSSAPDAGRIPPVPAADVPPSAPAYVIFTSGSTGEPKGVLHSHRNLLHHVEKFRRVTGLTCADRHAWIARYSHAGSISDVFPTLLSGATLTVYQPWRQGIAPMLGWLEQESVTVLHIVPTLLRRLASTAPGGEAAARPRLVRIAGEPVYGRDVRTCRTLFGGRCRVLTTLGTSELNLVRAFEAGADAGADDEQLPVGYAVEDTEVLIVGEDAVAQPPGATGRIAVRSRYLCNGYWGQPGLTAAAFHADPADARLRTFVSGDLGHLRPDGCLVHEGRVTDRVKVRGQGVDLLEVERAITALVPGLDVAVVDAASTGRHGKGLGDAMLVAWLAGGEAPGWSGSGLRRSLAQALPGYMIPSRFARIDTLPLTPGGKIDRQALRTRSLPPSPAADSPQRPAKPPPDARLAALWESLLDTRPVDEDDSFFDLGGDSLLAMCMLWEAGRLFGTEVSPLEFRHEPTLRGLARLLAKGHDRDGAGVLLPLQTGADRPPLFFVPGGGGGAFDFAFVYDRVLDQLPPDQPVYGLVETGLDESDRRAGMKGLVERYVAAMAGVQPRGPWHLAGDCVGALAAFQVACRIRREGGAVSLLALLDPPPPGALNESELRTRRRERWMYRRLGEMRSLARRIAHHRAELRRVSMSEWPAYLRDRLRNAGRLHSTYREAEAESRRRIRYQQAMRGAGAGDIYDGIVDLIYSADGAAREHEAAWRALTTGGARVRTVAGDHASYVRGSGASWTGHCLAELLAEALGPGGQGRALDDPTAPRAAAGQ